MGALSVTAGPMSVASPWPKKVKCCKAFNEWDFRRSTYDQSVALWAEDRWTVLEDIKFCPFCAKSVEVARG